MPAHARAAKGRMGETDQWAGARVGYEWGWGGGGDARVPLTMARAPGAVGGPRRRTHAQALRLESLDVRLGQRRLEELRVPPLQHAEGQRGDDLPRKAKRLGGTGAPLGVTQRQDGVLTRQAQGAGHGAGHGASVGYMS